MQHYRETICKKTHTQGETKKNDHDLQIARAIESKKGNKEQESIQSSTTPGPGYHMEK